MKKSIIAAALVGTMLLSGCSGVSQESYNSVVAENESFKNENSTLKSNNSTLESENAELQSKISELEKQNSDNEAIIEELQSDNVPLEAVDIILKALAHKETEIFSSDSLENVQQYVYTDFSMCHICNNPSYMPAANTASLIKNQETVINNVVDSGISSYVFLLKSYDKKNVCCYWWANKQSGWVWFDQDVKEEFEKL